MRGTLLSHALSPSPAALAGTGRDDTRKSGIEFLFFTLNHSFTRPREKEGMENNSDIADLERALAAVKARSTATAEKERAYLSRIKELEEVNRALVFKLANAGLVTGGAGDEANGAGQIPPGMPRSPSSEAFHI